MRRVSHTYLTGSVQIDVDGNVNKKGNANTYVRDKTLPLSSLMSTGSGYGIGKGSNETQHKSNSRFQTLMRARIVLTAVTVTLFMIARTKARWREV
jgi:hypothetical protein